MQLQTFIASTLLLSSLAGAVNLPRGEADTCLGSGVECDISVPCCSGHCIFRTAELGVSVAIYIVFVLTQLWRIVLPLIAAHIAPTGHKLSLMNRGQIKFGPVIACSYYFVSRSWL